MELDLAGTGFLLTDPRLDDHPIVYVNEPFLEMTGYSADEVLGRNCRFLQGEDTDEAAIDELRRAIADERPATVELVNYRKDGTPFWNQVHIARCATAKAGSCTSSASRSTSPLGAPPRRRSGARPSWPRPARCWTRRSTSTRRWTR